MAEDLRFPLLDTSLIKYSNEHEDFHYVFTFPNFYSDDEEIIANLSSKISLIACHSIYSSVFKIIQMSEESENKDVIGFKSSAWIEKTWKAFAIDTKNEETEWLRFVRMVAGLLVKVFQQELMLEVKMFLSRDESEIFLKVRASEYNLRVQADLMDYQVQINITRPYHPDAAHLVCASPKTLQRSDVYEKSGFSKVCPYGEFQNQVVGKDVNLEICKIYKTYKENGGKSHEESETSSVFRQKDKTRIVLGMITSVVDLGELIEHNIASQNFCLHNQGDLNVLREDWGSFGKFWKPQNLNAVRKYFGEKIAMYFAWLEYYLLWLIIPALAGIGATVAIIFAEPIRDDKFNLSEISLFAFSLVLSVGSTVLDQVWIRRQNELAWVWGTVDMIEVEQQRPNFRGVYQTDVISGQKRKVNSDGRNAKCKRSVGYTVTTMFVFSVLAIIIAIFIAKRDYSEWENEFSLVNAFQIKIMNFLYRYVAKMLNNWENYEYDSQYNDALTMKLYIFQFINSYSALFYIAFFKTCPGDCMSELSTQLMYILILNTFLNIVELGVPYLKNKLALRRERKRIVEQNQEGRHIREDLSPEEEQARLPDYETPLDDYMELIINYGYVVMFSVAFPLFPFVSFVLNILEVRVDAYKLCFLTKKPYPAPANSIGEWQGIVRTISIFGALTNTGILIFTAKLTFFGMDPWICFIVIEHGLLLFKWMVVTVWPHRSVTVRNGLVWSKRIASERIYGKASDLEEQKKKRNLYFEKSRNVSEFILDKKNLTADNS